jgi:hypothetical protein
VFPVPPGVAGIAGVLDAILAISDVPSLYVHKVTLRLRKGLDRETTSVTLATGGKTGQHAVAGPAAGGCTVLG